MIDRIFVNDKTEEDFTIVRAGEHKIDMLLEPDEKYLSQKPKRAFQGFRYMDGCATTIRFL